jgi:hypothetical protein
MRIILSLLVLSLIPTVAAAQQSDADTHVDVDYHCDKNPIAYVLCEEMEKRDKEARLKFEATEAERIKKYSDAVAEAKKIADDANKVRSTNKDEQIDGIVGTAKDINQHGNVSQASEAVTDKSLSAVEEFEHRENELLKNTDNAVRSGLEQRGAATSSFNAGEQHQLNESTRTTAETPQQTPEQQFLDREQTLLYTPSVRTIVTEVKSTKSVPAPEQVTPEEQFRNREAKMLASPSTVRSVAQADQAIQAKERERLAIEAKKPADVLAKKAAADRVAAAAATAGPAFQQAEADRGMGNGSEHSDDSDDPCGGRSRCTVH